MSHDESKQLASILFTAFEPSGDAHAAPVIAELARQLPDVKIYAWGGPKMEAAGATILGHTASDGAMGLSALSKANAVRREVRRIKRWTKQYRVLAHVAVDSPAANFPICKVMRRVGARVIHLVAPQLWAWGGWRVGKLRRRTDLVLCLLPFEEQWFNDRQIPARFIGHPVMNRELDTETIQHVAADFPPGTPKVAIFPGSRSHEVKKNIRLLTAAFTELQGRHHGMAGLVVAANADIAALIRKKVKVFPTGMHMVTSQVDPAIAWADLAIAVSGTVTLDILRQATPMVGVYKTGPFGWLISKLLLRTPVRLLPNIIAEQEICPEFVPHLGGPMPIVAAVSEIVRDSKNAATQTAALRSVAQRYSNKRPAQEAATHIVKLLKGE